MPHELSLGKTWGLRRLSTSDGIFTMLALDQRPPIAQLIAKQRDVPTAEVSFNDMVDVKRLIAGSLADRASAVLMDPNYAIPASLPDLSPRCGLMLTLEDHRFDETPDGRRSHPIANWSIAKIKRAGGDGVKLLIWYRPDAGASVLAHQQAFVAAAGEQCKTHDIPLVLELLVYPFEHDGNDDAARQDMTARYPELVIESIREFAKPHYGVDLFKLESPIPGANLPARDNSAAHQAAQAHFDQIGDICRQAGVPWVMLSAGVSDTQFLRVMAYACAAGASGFLAGRAVWWQAMQAFPDLAQCKSALDQASDTSFRQLIEFTQANALGWHGNYDALKQVQSEGEFCAMVT